MADHCFISYSTADALEFARQLADELEGGEDKFIDAWLDKRDIDPARDWDDQIVEGIKTCKCMAFVMSRDSTAPGTMCKNEWTWALKCKKPVIPIRYHNDAEQPFGLGNRQWVDFTGEFEHGLAQLRMFLRKMDSPEGVLQSLKDRLADAERDFRRTKAEDQPRIQADIDELKKQIETQEKIIANPKAAEDQTKKNIEAGLERERQPEKPIAGKSETKFINPPPGVAPNYFQDRLIENKQIVDFLNNDSQRLLTIVGRAGVGKTAMICRMLKGLERGILPDDLGEMKADGIVYLSEAGSHRVNFANIFADLSKLLPKETAERLDSLYKEPKISTGDKMRALLDAFPQGRVVLLLDNFENLIDSEGLNIRDSELSDALSAMLSAPQHMVKTILTTRIAPRDLPMVEPGRQYHLSLDDGLESPYAENVLREMDADGRVGLKTASNELLDRAREKTRGYPRALEALFMILSADRYTMLEEILNTKLPDEVVHALVGQAFSRLDPTAQKVMQALAVYNRPVIPAAVDFLLQPFVPSIDSTPVLNRLVSMHFVRREAGKYYLHPADSEYAWDTIPGGYPDDKLRTSKGVELLNYYYETLSKYPDFIQTAAKPKSKRAREALQKIAEKENIDLLRDLEKSMQKLDPTLLQKIKDGNNFKDEAFLAELDQSLYVPQAWNEYALTFRAADYFAQARKPRAEWKKLEDLSAQLAEFDLRCAADDYGAAANVLGEVEHEYLFLWGNYRLIINLRLRLKGNLQDKVLLMSNLRCLGDAYEFIGKFKEAYEYYESGLRTAQAEKQQYDEGLYLGSLGRLHSRLGEINEAVNCCEGAQEIFREIGARQNEGAVLTALGQIYADIGDMNKSIESFRKRLNIAHEMDDQWGEGHALTGLGLAYAKLGMEREAIEYFRQRILIAREIGDRQGEALDLGNTGISYLSLGEYKQAIDFMSQAIQIADEISYADIQIEERWGMAQANLFQNDLVNARAAIEAALGYDVPQYNHDVSALHGIIALRQGDEVTARGAFVRAIGQADEILSKTAEYYSALDAKGLAICGLILCRGVVPTPNVSMPAARAPEGATKTGREDLAPTVNDAIETFKKARKIAPHAGIVKSVLRLFDELAKCDKDGALKDVRSAVEG